MDALLWIAQWMLAVVFVIAGTVKIVKPASNRFGGRNPTVRVIGIAELAGGLGVVLPALTGIAPILTPIAAVGLALTMVGAIVTDLRLRRGLAGVLLPVVLLAIAVFVAWGRFGPYAL